MGECLIVCRSMTYAQRADRAFNRAGLRSTSVTKIKNGLDKEGCVYGVRLQCKDVTTALEILDKHDYTQQGVYSVDADGNYKELNV